MTGSRVTRLLTLVATAVAMAAIAVVVPVAVGATPDVTSCIERNLPRYSNPGSAVVAQYSDVEALCQGMIDDGSSVEFEPSSGGGGSSSGTGGSAPASPSTGTAPESAPGTAGGGVSSPGAESPAPAEPRPRQPQRASRPVAPADEAAGTPSAAQFVAASIQESGAARGSPLPSSVSNGALWLYLLLGGAAAAIAGAATVAARRRR